MGNVCRDDEICFQVASKCSVLMQRVYDDFMVHTNMNVKMAALSLMKNLAVSKPCKPLIAD